MPGSQDQVATLLSRSLGTLPDPLPIPHRPTVSDVEVRPPGSKSLTNRALVLAGLANGSSRLRGALLDADDALRLMAALEKLGARVHQEAGGVRVAGVNGRWRPASDETALNLGNAGTATRFLTASAVLSHRPVVIDGNSRMRERPIGDLAAAVRELGARVEFLDVPGYPPLRITPGTIPPGASVTLGDLVSSQFVSGLMMAGPWIPGGLTIRVSGRVASGSYITMTASLMQRLGVSVRVSDEMRVIRVGGPAPGAFDLDIEPDASGATYFWGAAALIEGLQCRVTGLGRDSLQRDAAFPDVLARMGAIVGRRAVGSDLGPAIGVRGSGRLEGIAEDMSDMPDAAMTLAVVACFARGTTTIHGVRTLRVKETDRIAALRAELGKIGVKVETGIVGDDDTITVTPPTGGVDCSPGVRRVEFETYGDHRMAMSLSLVGLRRPNVWIRDPGCVSKTYPGYWRDFARLYGG